MTEVEIAREKYQPKPTIKYLLIAEAPPSAVDRFFYYEDIWKQDSLFLETMKVLYMKKRYPAATVRLNKRKFLQRFMEDGFYLMDASTQPMPEGSNGTAKERKLKESLSDLVARMKSLEARGIISRDTPVILIGTPVYNVCKESLIMERFNVINSKAVPSASSGQQANFKAELEKLRDSLQIKQVDILASH